MKWIIIIFKKKDINDITSVIKEVDDNVGMAESIKVYLNEISKNKLLTPEEEKELFIKYKTINNKSFR